MIVFVYDRFGKQKDILHDFTKFVHDDELGSFDFVDLTVLGNHVQKGDYLVWKDYNGKWRENIVSKVNLMHSKGVLMQDIHAPNSITETSRNFFDEGINFGSIQSALESLLKKTRWSYGKVDDIDSFRFTLRYETVYEGLCDIKTVSQETAYYTTEIDLANGNVSKRTLNYIRDIGRDKGITFFYGYDMEDVEQIVDADEVITRLHCYGKDLGDNTSEEDKYIYERYKKKTTFTPLYGVDYVEDNAAKEKYGILDKNGVLQHSEGLFIDGRYEDWVPLRQAGLKRLEEVSKPRVTYKAKINTIFKEKYMDTDIMLGDIVTIHDSVLDEIISNKIVRIRRDYLNVLNTDVTLGNVVRTIKRF